VSPARFAGLSLLPLVVLLAGGCARGGPAPPANGSASTSAAGAVSGRAGGPCPSETPLDPGPDARAGATAAALASVPARYAALDTAGFAVSKVYPARSASGYGSIAYSLCGSAVGDRTWVVELTFPKELPSADLSSGQLFLARFPAGWQVWYQYH
jgi:hypothetical protein